MRTSPPRLAPLFRSDGQARLLAEIFLSGADELSISDLVERTGVSWGSTHREAERLVAAGLLQERRVGNSRLLRPNPLSPLTKPVRDLVVVTAGPVPLLARELAEVPEIIKAFIFGSYAARALGIAGEPPNDIDLMVVGSPDEEAVYAACRRVGDVVGRPVNPVIMTTTEWEKDSAFIGHVRSKPVVPVLGDAP